MQIPVIALLLLTSAGLGAQEPVQPGVSATHPSERPLRVFLDCQSSCDRDYLVTELPYIHFVRDRLLADVHILITSLQAASGGEVFTITFAAQEALTPASDTIVTATEPGATDDDERELLRRSISRGLFPYAARSSVGAQLDVLFLGDMDEAEGVQVSGDRWNSWVFEAEAGGSADIEQRRRSWSMDGELGARRITDSWKVEIELEGEYEFSDFELSGGRSASDAQRSYGVDALVVRSLGSHLSAGFTAAAAHSDFYNQRLAARLGPAIEYNFLDWAQATRQRVTMRYSIGLTRFDYLEETIYLRESETVVSQHVGLAGRLRKPWGSVNASVVFGNIVNEPSKNVLSADAFGEVRIAEGLSVFAEVESSRVRNQIYLPRGDLTDEEILLGQRALATGYRFEMRAGLSYTFGSIYNTIVNPRFGEGVDIF